MRKLAKVGSLEIYFEDRIRKHYIFASNEGTIIREPTHNEFEQVAKVLDTSALKINLNEFQIALLLIAGRLFRTCLPDVFVVARTDRYELTGQRVHLV